MTNHKLKAMSCKNNADNSCNYEINNKVRFIPNVNVSEEDVENCLVFCWNMTYGKDGEHRDHRTGGIKKRTNREIFQDIFIGKMGEIAFYKFIKKRNKAQISEVDYDCFGLGEWDASDFTLVVKDEKIEKDKKTYKVAVKTTKSFGNLLLLEMNDWTVIKEEAVYIPNKEKNGNGVYDFIFLCRVDSNISKMDFEDITREKLTNFANDLRLKLQVVGYISNRILAKVITSNEYVIHQGDTLNVNTKMDADNYYIQSGSFIQLTE